MTNAQRGSMTTIAPLGTCASTPLQGAQGTGAPLGVHYVSQERIVIAREHAENNGPIRAGAQTTWTAWT
eukprot:15259253-Heterocapsa_arctica.AAC.1